MSVDGSGSSIFSWPETFKNRPFTIDYLTRNGREDLYEKASKKLAEIETIMAQDLAALELTHEADAKEDDDIKVDTDLPDMLQSALEKANIEFAVEFLGIEDYPAQELEETREQTSSAFMKCVQEVIDAKLVQLQGQSLEVMILGLQSLSKYIRMVLKKNPWLSPRESEKIDDLQEALNAVSEFFKRMPSESSSIHNVLEACGRKILSLWNKSTFPAHQKKIYEKCLSTAFGMFLPPDDFVHRNKFMSMREACVLQFMTTIGVLSDIDTYQYVVDIYRAGCEINQLCELIRRENSASTEFVDLVIKMGEQHRIIVEKIKGWSIRDPIVEKLKMWLEGVTQKCLSLSEQLERFSVLKSDPRIKEASQAVFSSISELVTVFSADVREWHSLIRAMSSQREEESKEYEEYAANHTCEVYAKVFSFLEEHYKSPLKGQMLVNPVIWIQTARSLLPKVRAMSGGDETEIRHLGALQVQGAQIVALKVNFVSKEKSHYLQLLLDYQTAISEFLSMGQQDERLTAKIEAVESFRVAILEFGKIMSKRVVWTPQTLPGKEVLTKPDLRRCIDLNPINSYITGISHNQTILKSNAMIEEMKYLLCQINLEVLKGFVLSRETAQS